MKIIGMIPARMGSSRFPGKPLAELLGRPMIEHVFKRVAMSEILSDVFIATCDEEIRSATESFGGKAVMTSDKHERASDRIAEAAKDMDAHVVVMIQGDEPMTHPDMIGEAVAPFLTSPEVQCVNLTKRIDDIDEYRNPNTIKVVTDRSGDALYFSRAPIPYTAGDGIDQSAPYKQVCVIPFLSQALRKFSQLEPTPLEIAESVDMMRFLEHGVPVRMVETRHHTHAVDTPEDLALVEKLMGGDPLNESY